MSVSRKQCYNQCPYQYRYKYHDKIEVDEPIADHFVYGTIIHKIVEDYIRCQGQKSIHEIAKTVLLSPNEKGILTPIPQQYNKKFPIHLENLKKLSDQIGYDGELEWPFLHDLDPPNQRCVKGFIDRLIIRGEKYFVLDYKTTKKGMWRKNSNTIRNDLQLRTYARIIQKTFGAKPENIRAALFYVEGAEIVSAKFTEEQLISAEKELFDTYIEIENLKAEEAAGRLGNHCKFCVYRKICPWYSLV